MISRTQGERFAFGSLSSLMVVFLFYRFSLFACETRFSSLPDISYVRRMRDFLPPQMVDWKPRYYIGLFFWEMKVL